MPKLFKIKLKYIQTRCQEQASMVDDKNDPLQGVLKLKELVSYQQGSVVSREIIRKNTGTVTLFAFDEGQGLSEHTAPFDALGYIVDGDAEITVSGQANKVSEGEMLILPAGQPHALRALHKFKMMLVMIRS
jgi:quercetin dioxygenase-like cupin family protein